MLFLVFETLVNRGFMVADGQLEVHIQKNHLAIEELSIKIEALNRDVDTLLLELGVTPEQLTKFLDNSGNFTQENWNSLLEQRKALDEKLLRALVNIADPLKRKKTYADRHVQSHWLFVR